MSEPIEMFQWLDPDWLRAFHILAVIAWMAGMLMLPRLYAYQTGAVIGGELDQKMIAASGRLRAIILTPAMVITWVFGILQLGASNWVHMSFGWMHAKLALLIILTGLHGYMVAEGKRLAKGERRRSEKFWRLLNEVPFLIAIAIVVLAVVEPF